MKETLEERRNKFEQLYSVWKNRGIYEQFLWIKERFPDTPFLITEGYTMTYEQAAVRINQVAAVLKEQGIEQGNHVAVSIYDGAEFVMISFALFQLGAVKIPTNQGLSFPELDYVFKQSDTEYIISQWEFNDIFLNGLPQVKGAIALENRNPDNKRTKVFWELMDNCRGDSLSEYSKINSADAADIMFTSGSTGFPKGVILTHEMLLKSAYANDYNRGFEPGRRIYIPIALNHIFGYVEGIIASIVSGSTLVFSSGKFQAEKALECIEKNRVNDMLVVPSMILKVMQSEKFEETDISSLYAMYCGASVCSDRLWEDIREQFHITELITGYGMTELAGATMQTDPLDEIRIMQKRVGKVMSYLKQDSCVIEYKVVDKETGKTLSPQVNGELWCKGTMVMSGYYKNEKANAESFTKDGWFKTGDFGRFDQDGYLQLIGRCNDQYKVNGENISPYFLEHLIGNYDNIQSVELVGVEDEKSGFAGMAFLELVKDSLEDRRAVVARCKQDLPSFQFPKYFVFGKRSDWAQTSVLKVQKYKLKKMAKEMLKVDPDSYKASNYLK